MNVLKLIRKILGIPEKIECDLTPVDSTLLCEMIKAQENKIRMKHVNTFYTYMKFIADEYFDKGCYDLYRALISDINEFIEDSKVCYYNDVPLYVESYIRLMFTRIESYKKK